MTALGRFHEALRRVISVIEDVLVNPPRRPRSAPSYSILGPGLGQLQRLGGQSFPVAVGIGENIPI
jgi:hypothetical protein